LEAGTAHVITARTDTDIQTFTQVFYQKLWQQKSKICECFWAAKKAVHDHANNFTLSTAIEH
jgi:hypothetical protein